VRKKCHILFEWPLTGLRKLLEKLNLRLVQICISLIIVVRSFLRVLAFERCQTYFKLKA
jgi:hypothetical protein